METLQIIAVSDRKEGRDRACYSCRVRVAHGEQLPFFLFLLLPPASQASQTQRRSKCSGANSWSGKFFWRSIQTPSVPERSSPVDRSRTLMGNLCGMWLS